MELIHQYYDTSTLTSVTFLIENNLFLIFSEYALSGMRICEYGEFIRLNAPTINYDLWEACEGYYRKSWGDGVTLFWFDKNNQFEVLQIKRLPYRVEL